HPQEQRAEQRTARAADRRDHRHADLGEQRRGRFRFRLVERGDGGPHPAVHVGAVVAVADRGVQIGRWSRFSATSRANARIHACRLALDTVSVMYQMPHLNAGVLTGASHSDSRFSSTLSSVTEVPAISREVIYGPT